MTLTDQHTVDLSAQLDCYRKLAKLSELQSGYVRQNLTDQLLDVLQQRSGLLAEIARLEQSVGPLRREWSEVSVGLDDDTRSRLQAMLSETKTLLHQITTADQDDVLLLQQRKLNVGKQIQATQTARKVNTRYAAAAYGNKSGSTLNVKK
jgi:hypothetical protein